MAHKVTIYGIKACDTMKKARRWLESHGIDYGFHDYKTQGIEPTRLREWVQAVGWQPLLNRNGTTFRKLPDADKADLDETKALDLMRAHPSLIKRPVLQAGGALIVGFTAEKYAKASLHQQPMP